ncbi:MAG TPA: sigma-70 family RNA polymerase sigma factor [Polyangiaceae bacterium]|jgi:RNA polymerase sigma-70 factor (ECF subfamily)|nr:sigma-70 family RNA polymerase sigma factor [Polyangiaceae bacterium]
MKDSIEQRHDSSDIELVQRMSRGDSAALAALYERHAPKLSAIAHHLLGQPNDAEDVLHDVFLEVWRHANDYSEARGSVWSWLAVRTRSRAIDRRRSAPRRLSVELSDDHLDEQRFRDGAMSDSPSPDRERLKRALRLTSVEEREVLWLGYFEGLSSSEIALKIGIPLGTVKSRARSALAKLRAEFVSKGEAP